MSAENNSSILSESKWAFAPLVVFLSVALLGLISLPAEDPVRSVLEGRVTISAEIDDTENYSGIEVLVVSQRMDGVDTLGYAETDRSGHFRMEVEAPQRDVYPLIVRRGGETHAVADFVVADGEVASFEVELPGMRGLTQIRSDENAAWSAYRNAKQMQNERFTQMFTDTLSSTEQLEANVTQTATLLWSLQNSFPETLGAKVAAAESITMMAGWNDEVVLERISEIQPDNPRFIEVGRAAREAAARLHGQDAALSLLREYKQRGSEQQQASLHAEIVLAHMDSLEQESARQEAEAIQQQYGHIEGWAEWSERMTYEIDNLMPGSPAPDFDLTTMEGENIQLNNLEGELVLLEFYHPQDGTFAQQLQARRTLYEASQENPFTMVTISLEPDESRNQAFLDGRDVPGHHVILPGGGDHELVERYNIYNVPTRVLIDEEGNLVNKYMGGALPALQEQIATLLSDQIEQ